MNVFKGLENNKKIFKKFRRSLHFLITLIFIFNMSYLGMFFSVEEASACEDEPMCGDGIINQAAGTEQCDGNTFLGGYEEGFTCNNKCHIEATTPVCTLDENDYDHIINLQNKKLVSSGASGYASSTPAYNASFVADGTYSVTLQAYDAYYGRSGANQLNEQYQLIFFDEDGLVVATSSPHADLADGENINYAMITEEVNTALQLTGVKTVSGIHAYLNTVAGAKSPNSVDAICAGLKLNDDENGGGGGNGGEEEDKPIKLAPSFSYAGLQCLNVGSGVEINFTNTSSSTSGYNLMWNFGDNATSTQANPSHTYTAAGSYNVALTLTSTSTSTSTPVIATATSTIAITNCNINGGGSGGSGGSGGGGGTYSGGGGSGVTSFAISNTQVTMMCVNDKVNMNISWLTTNPATSRVVYDKNSHAAGNIGLAPNYNYASSTVLYSNNVTGHNVSVNGLEPNTFYYFRPISVYNSIENVGQEKPLTQTLSCGPGSSEVIVLGEEGAPTITIDSDFLVNFTNPGATGVDYRIIVKNNGGLPSYETVLNSLLPEDITFQDGGLASKMWNLGDLGVGETKVIMTKVNVSAEAEAKTYIAKASVYSANHDEVNSETDLDVRKIAVLAETGFSNLQFIALLGLIVLIFGARIFLLKNRKRKPILVKKTIKLFLLDE
ncbi:PKD domain-containing protein [Candidatus Falkowbacteria bacterium]|nr:PKD domain-containing protein [Candidatus Falkowbacteria bacterium]